MLLTACTDDDIDVGSEDSDNDGSAASEGGDITVSTAGDVVSLDPHGSNDSASELVRTVIMEGLVDFDEDGELVNSLASDYEQIEDTTWEFDLREGVEFHDGSEFNAEVVKANIDRITDPLVGSERSYLLEMIEEVEVIDDYTVHMHTEYPFAPLVMNLGHGAGKMLSKEQIDEDYENALSEADIDMTLDEYYTARDEGDEDLEETAGDISDHVGDIVEQQPIGTGYMMFESRSPGEETVLANYENYWDEPAILDTITFKVVPESGARIAELETGTTEITDDLTTNNIDRIETEDSLELYEVESNQVDYIGMNTESENLTDVNVRQAIAHAIDRESVIDGIFNGSGTPAYGPLPPSFLGYTEEVEGIEYDMERASELLEEAGYDDGLDLTIAVNDDNEERVDLAVWLQESLEELGINADVQQLEWGAFLEATGNGEYDLFVSGWMNVTGSSDNAIYPLLHTDNIGQSGNRSYFSNDELDQMLEDARIETDDNVRSQIYTDAQDLVIEEAPMAFVRFGENLVASTDNIDGLIISRNGYFDFRETTIE